MKNFKIISFENVIKILSPNLSNYIKEKLKELDKYCYLSCGYYNNRFNLHSRNEDTNGDFRNLVLAHFIIEKYQFYLSERCSQNKNVFQYDGYTEIYKTQEERILATAYNKKNYYNMKRYLYENIITSGGDNRKAIRITNLNVEDIVKTILNIEKNLT